LIVGQARASALNGSSSRSRLGSDGPGPGPGARPLGLPRRDQGQRPGVGPGPPRPTSSRASRATVLGVDRCAARGPRWPRPGARAKPRLLERHRRGTTDYPPKGAGDPGTRPPARAQGEFPLPLRRSAPRTRTGPMSRSSWSRTRWQRNSRVSRAPRPRGRVPYPPGPAVRPQSVGPRTGASEGRVLGTVRPAGQEPAALAPMQRPPFHQAGRGHR